MKPEQEEFDSLRRLLALKRYEQPPPGYFDRFSGQVIARIQAGEFGRDETLAERLFAQAPWLQWLWTSLERKPILAGTFGAALCGLLLAGVVYSEAPSGNLAPVALLPAPESPQPFVASQFAAGHTTVTPLLTRADGLDLSNTGGVVSVQSGPSLFQEFNQAQRPWVVMPASYQSTGGN